MKTPPPNRDGGQGRERTRGAGCDAPRPGVRGGLAGPAHRQAVPAAGREARQPDRSDPPGRGATPRGSPRAARTRTASPRHRSRRPGGRSSPAPPAGSEPARAAGTHREPRSARGRVGRTERRRPAAGGCGAPRPPEGSEPRGRSRAVKPPLHGHRRRPPSARPPSRRRAADGRSATGSAPAHGSAAAAEGRRGVDDAVACADDRSPRPAATTGGMVAAGRLRSARRCRGRGRGGLRGDSDRASARPTPGSRRGRLVGGRRRLAGQTSGVVGAALVAGGRSTGGGGCRPGTPRRRGRRPGAGARSAGGPRLLRGGLLGGGGCSAGAGLRRRPAAARRPAPCSSAAAAPARSVGRGLARPAWPLGRRALLGAAGCSAAAVCPPTPRPPWRSPAPPAPQEGDHEHAQPGREAGEA